ncbi:hypothetical protein EI94DRAFT_1703296 [Lactarius quietus]|nr:hypothetical protein EI94DRAFT_1703296 [Lactarius quietus]
MHHDPTIVMHITEFGSSFGLQAPVHQPHTDIQECNNPDPKGKEEACMKLSALEGHVSHVKGGMCGLEALGLGNNLVKTGGAIAGVVWWDMITSSGKKGLMIKASDGRDVTKFTG